MVLCGCSSVIHSEGFPDYDRFAQRGYAAEELAKKVGVGFGVNVVCPMIRDLEHGLRKIELKCFNCQQTYTHDSKNSTAKKTTQTKQQNADRTNFTLT